MTDQMIDDATSDGPDISPDKPGSPRRSHQAGLAAMGLAALGIVFGDIGTSPLYTFKTVLALSGDASAASSAIGILSLIIWTLVIITSVKYVAIAMSIDNDGEGGVLALMSLIGNKRHRRPLIIAAGLFGAALIYGDGAITPAISVLSALEGLDLATPAFHAYILPMSVVILIALFAIQPRGTEWIGRAFGPIMALWFVVIALLGIGGIVLHPSVVVALNPFYGLYYLFSNGFASFLVLGSVFLCVTGAEALYADMGHFGARPIRLAWSGLVLPALVLNYAGQAAIVMTGQPITDNIFFQLCPSPLIIPLVILSTVATVIASQSIITGAFSMTRQAIQLGWLPRLRITQTSEKGYGQIYVGVVNWLLMIVTLGLTLGFGKSDNLAAAYGIAVSLTMLMTTVLIFIAMREIWGWSLIAAGSAAGALLIVDAAFFAANAMKVLEGGYVPLVLATVVYGIMLVWHRGSVAISTALTDRIVPVEEFLASLETEKVPRVAGTAVFLTRTKAETPPVMIWHVKRNRALHQHLFVLTATTEPVPWIDEADRLQVVKLAPDFWRATARYGFMERPDLPKLLQEAHMSHGCTLDLSDVTYYVGHETVIARDDGKGLMPMEEALFAAMQRNSVHVTDFFRLPSESVVEIGRQIAI